MIINEILFIAPFCENYEELFNYTSMASYSGDTKATIKKFSFSIPMAAVALGSWIKEIKPSVKINIIDYNVIVYKKIKSGKLLKKQTFKDIVLDELKKLKELGHSPDTISITLNITNEYLNFCTIVECAKEVFPKATIIAGGVTLTHIFEKVLNDCEGLNAVCLGEGEIPFEELIKEDIDIYNVFKSCEAWVTRDKDFSKVHPIQLKNLDILPPYNFKLLGDLQVYFETTYSNHPFKELHIKEMFLTTSRGCVYNCYFCNSKAIQGQGIRYHSEDWVYHTIDNICENLKPYGINCIGFVDELLFIKFDRAKKFMEYCKSNGLYAHTGNDSFITASQEVVDLLKTTGPGYTSLPLESGSERVLKDVIKKKFDIKKVPEVIKMYRAAGLVARVGVMIGLPGETKKDIEDELKYYIDLPIDWLSINIATPFPGSDMYNDCIQNNYLTCKEISEINLKRAVITTEDFTADYIQDMAYYINLMVNFKYNYNMKIGEYERALKMFESVLQVAPNHAIAFYYMSICLEKIGRERESKELYNKYIQISEDNEFWQNWIERIRGGSL